MHEWKYFTRLGSGLGKVSKKQLYVAGILEISCAF